MLSRQSHSFLNALAALFFIASLLLCVAGRDARAQSADGWVTVAPKDEAFSVSLPSEPSLKSQPALPTVGSPAGRLYSLKHGWAEYRVWSLQGAQVPGNDALAVSDFLDSCAEMAWTLIVSPELESAMRAGNRDAATRYQMAIMRETKTDSAQAGFNAREYSVALGERTGRAYIFADGSRAYVALAFGRAGDDTNLHTFLDSFALHTPGGDFAKMPPANAGSGVATGNGGGVGPGRGGNTGGGIAGANSVGESAPVSCDELSKRVFAPKEMTRKARILTRPEPTYTEWARKFSVIGTVRVRAVLSASGAVTNIVAVTQLPHGLTRKAIEAMRAISFDPAEKDGCKVSQYVTVDYNFNIY